MPRTRLLPLSPSLDEGYLVAAARSYPGAEACSLSAQSPRLRRAAMKQAAVETLAHLRAFCSDSEPHASGI